jgi:sensor histidine kinase regulating citrate/malate metabolism
VIEAQSTQRQRSTWNCAPVESEGSVVAATAFAVRWRSPKGCSYNPKQGLGLASIRERARLLSGSVRVGSQPGSGTEVVVEIPLNSTG